MMVRTTDPRHIGPEDVEGFLLWMKQQNYAASTKRKYLSILNSYLKVWNNSVILSMKASKGRLIPKRGDHQIRTNTYEEMQAIFDAADVMKGHRGKIIQGVIALMFGTMTRPKEIIAAEVSDLDLERNTFFVRHPKGEGSWGVPQIIPVIRGDMIPRLESYLEWRRGMCADHGIISNYLFPKEDGTVYTLKAIRKMKEEVERISGVRFMLKTLRATAATMAIAGDVSRLKAVSLQLRHASVATTEAYYLAINKTAEIKSTLGDAWKNSEIRSQ